MPSMTIVSASDASASTIPSASGAGATMPSMTISSGLSAGVPVPSVTLSGRAGCCGRRAWIASRALLDFAGSCTDADINLQFGRTHSA